MAPNVEIFKGRPSPSPIVHGVHYVRVIFPRVGGRITFPRRSRSPSSNRTRVVNESKKDKVSSDMLLTLRICFFERTRLKIRISSSDRTILRHVAMLVFVIFFNRPMASSRGNR